MRSVESRLDITDLSSPKKAIRALEFVSQGFALLIRLKSSARNRESGGASTVETLESLGTFSNAKEVSVNHIETLETNISRLCIHVCDGLRSHRDLKQSEKAKLCETVSAIAMMVIELGFSDKEGLPRLGNDIILTASSKQ